MKNQTPLTGFNVYNLLWFISPNTNEQIMCLYQRSFVTWAEEDEAIKII